MHGFNEIDGRESVIFRDGKRSLIGGDHDVRDLCEVSTKEIRATKWHVRVPEQI